MRSDQVQNRLVLLCSSRLVLCTLDTILRSSHLSLCNSNTMLCSHYQQIKNKLCSLPVFIYSAMFYLLYSQAVFNIQLDIQRLYAVQLFCRASQSFSWAVLVSHQPAILCQSFVTITSCPACDSIARF